MPLILPPSNFPCGLLLGKVQEEERRDKNPYSLRFEAQVSAFFHITTTSVHDSLAINRINPIELASLRNKRQKEYETYDNLVLKNLLDAEYV